MRVTYPNQRIVHINREKVKTDFLGIKNFNWKYAARDLGAHALMLYLYLASNANNYNLALSPADIAKEIGMPRSTYHDQFQKLVNKGYLVQKSSNNYEFYEVAQARDVSAQNALSQDGLNFDECTASDSENQSADKPVSAEDTEINKIDNINNLLINNNDDFPVVDGIYRPKVIEVKIPVPQRQPKKGFEF